MATPLNTTTGVIYLVPGALAGAGDGSVPTGVATGSVLISNGVGVQGVWSADPFATTLTSSRTALATTSTDGVIAINTTAATGGATVQMSPRLRLRGNAWDTAASQTHDFFIENLPVSAATPTGTLKFGASLNGAAATYPLTLTSAGVLTATSTIVAAQYSTTGTGGSYYVTTRSGFSSPADGRIIFTNNAASAGIGFDIATDGTFKLRGTAFTAGTGSLDIGAKVTSYNAVATAGWGVPAIQAAGRVTAQSAANASIATYTVGAADGSFQVSANMNVTASTTLVTTLTCTYTDESNTARSMIFPVTSLSGSFIAAGAITGAGASVWETPVMHIRCKAATAITILTSAGTFTGITYTAEGIIKQVA